MRESVARVGRALGVDVAISGGVALIDGSADAEAVLAEADRAMYEAKASGNSIVVAGR